MPADLAKIVLLDRLYKLRRRRRLSASIITTFSINLPFYEDVVLRYLEAAGSRLNVLLVDASELSKSFLVESTRPRRAGRDYLVLPVRAGGAFHPKIIALYSDQGTVIAIGSHNVTEAGLGRNGEISATFGFDGPLPPLNVSQSVTEYLIQCASQLAPGDNALSRRLTDRLRQQSRRGTDSDHDVTFVGVVPGRDKLLETTFNREELAAARRILVLGPYFDDDLEFLAELRKRAPRAQLSVAVQPDHAIIRNPRRLPAGTRLCNADGAPIRLSQQFIHAKAIVVEVGKQIVVVIGSANPSSPAWVGNSRTGNFEGVIAMRGETAKKALQALALDRLWEAPLISKEQLKQIEIRSRKKPEDENVRGAATVSALWKDGWVEAKLEEARGDIRMIRTLTGPDSITLALEGAGLKNGILRFPTPTPGAFAVEFGKQSASTIVIASSVAELSRTLVSATAGRLIDELGRLSDGGAPGEELLNLCERVLLQSDDDAEELSPRSRPRARSEDQQSDGDTRGPRGISIQELGRGSRKAISLSLDISAIITLLLKQLEAPVPEKADPTVEEDESTEDTTANGAPADEDQASTRAQWDDIVRAIRPRITRLLNRLSDRIEEPHPAKWKYERVLVLLALMKRLRKYHPGTTIPYSGRPERLVDEDHLRDAFKLAMHCCFARGEGVVGALELMGGLDHEYEIIGRSLLLWAAYEAGVDIQQSLALSVDPDELRASQADRTDALISAIAACASPETIQRARRELFDRGDWAEPCDRIAKIESWFDRHAKVGKAIQKALACSDPSRLPVVSRAPSLQDVVIWKSEPGWPRFPEMVSGRAVHLADVGDAEPLKIAPQFVQPIDIDALGIRNVLSQSRGSLKSARMGRL
jgi:hypothetical protein